MKVENILSKGYDFDKMNLFDLEYWAKVIDMFVNLFSSIIDSNVEYIS